MQKLKYILIVILFHLKISPFGEEKKTVAVNGLSDGSEHQSLNELRM
jgi:hypothetical protein